MKKFTLILVLVFISIIFSPVSIADDSKNVTDCNEFTQAGVFVVYMENKICVLKSVTDSLGIKPGESITNPEIFNLVTLLQISKLLEGYKYKSND